MLHCHVAFLLPRLYPFIITICSYQLRSKNRLSFVYGVIGAQPWLGGPHSTLLSYSAQTGADSVSAICFIVVSRLFFFFSRLFESFVRLAAVFFFLFTLLASGPYTSMSISTWRSPAFSFFHFIIYRDGRRMSKTSNGQKGGGCRSGGRDKATAGPSKSSKALSSG